MAHAHDCSSTARATATRIAASSRAPSSASWGLARWRRRRRRRRPADTPADACPSRCRPSAGPQADAPATDRRRYLDDRRSDPDGATDLHRTDVVRIDGRVATRTRLDRADGRRRCASVMSLRWRSRGRSRPARSVGRHPPQSGSRAAVACIGTRRLPGHSPTMALLTGRRVPRGGIDAHAHHQRHDRHRRRVVRR